MPKDQGPSLAAVSTEQPAAIEQPAPKADIKPLPRGGARLFEFSSNVWSCTAPTGCKPEDLDAHPSFWNSLADEIREGDEIKTIAADRSWHACYVVTHSQPGSLIARLAYQVQGTRGLAAVGPKTLPAGYEIRRTEPGDPMPGYYGIRVADGVRFLNSGMPYESWQAAYEALLAHAIFRTDKPVQYLPG